MGGRRQRARGRLPSKPSVTQGYLGFLSRQEVLARLCLLRVDGEAGTVSAALDHGLGGRDGDSILVRVTDGGGRNEA